MAWDDDKSTASDPDNPAAGEQITATEWDTHVSDQKARMEYGLISNRPAASDLPTGSLWFDQYGRISRVNSSDLWEIESFGTSANPISGDSAFQRLECQTLSFNLQGCSVYLNSTQNITSGTFTRVAYDTKNYDERNEFDTSTNQWTATADGTYQIIPSLQYGGFTGSEIALQVMVNGSALSFTSRQQDSGFSTIGTTLVFRLSANDTVSVEARQSSGADQDLIASQSASNLTISRIG